MRKLIRIMRTIQAYLGSLEAGRTRIRQAVCAPSRTHRVSTC
jgi:hypothetical protein